MSEDVTAKENDEIIKGLCRALADEGFGYSLSDEGYIYVPTGLEFPMWIDFYAELSAIRIFSYARILADSFAEVDVLELVNRMNMHFVPNQVYYLDGCVYCCHTILVSGGISDHLFVSTLRHCAGAFVIAAQECDHANLFSRGAAH